MKKKQLLFNKDEGMKGLDTHVKCQTFSLSLSLSLSRSLSVSKQLVKTASLIIKHHLIAN